MEDEERNAYCQSESMNSQLESFYDYLIETKKYYDNEALGTIKRVYGYAETESFNNDGKVKNALADHASWLNSISNSLYSYGEDVVADDVFAAMSSIANMEVGDTSLKLEVMSDILLHWNKTIYDWPLSNHSYFVIRRESNRLKGDWKNIANIISASLPKLGGSNYYNMDNDSFRLLMEVSN